MPRSKSYALVGTTNWMDFYRPVKGFDVRDTRITLIHYGPAELGIRTDPVLDSGPEAFTRANKQLFATSSTSGPEGWFYWAMVILRGTHGENGGWQYQRKVRPGGSKVGGATVDFLIDARPRPIACRIQTPYFHRGDPGKAAFDREQAITLQRVGYDVVDAFSQLYYHKDTSGEAVLNMARRVIAKDPALVPGSATYIGDRG